SIAVAAEYYSKASLYSRDRAKVAGTADLSNDATGLGLGGTNNTSPIFAGRVSLLPPPTGPAPGELVLNDLSNNAPTGLADYMPFIIGTSQGYNFQETTPAIPSVEKALVYVSGRYKIFGDSLQLYGDVMYSKVKQYNGLSATPFTISNPFDGINVARASIYNPFPNNSPRRRANPQGNQLSSVSYRLVNELGNRQTLIDADYYRYVAGINGDLKFEDNAFISRFAYDSGFVYSENNNLTVQSGDATRQGILDQIALGNFNPFIGQTAPVSGFAPTYTNGVQTGTHFYDNKAAAQAASYVAHSNFNFSDYLVDIKMNAHLLPNLWNGGVDFTVGYEHHRNTAHFVVDRVLSAGDQLGFNGAINADFFREDDSFFTQLNVPIVTSPMNVPLVRSLDVSIAFRYEKITDTFEGILPGSDQVITREASFDNRNKDEDFGGSPRVSLRYQPTEDITFRASWGQSFSSPNSLALFIPVHPTFPVVNDSLRGVTLVPPAGVFVGGNPNLKPEKTDAYSAGVIWTPKFIPGFTMTVDWYQFFTRDLILSGDAFAQLALTANGNSGGTLFVDPDGFGGGGGFPFAPGGPGLGVTRTPAGDLVAIDSTDSNAGKRLVEGLDMTAVYEIPADRFGKFTISGGYNHFFTWKAEPIVGLGTHNFLGDTSSSFPLAPGAIPFNKAFLRGEWEWRNFDFVATGNYIGDYEDDPSAIQGNTIIGGTIVEPQYTLHRRTTDYITLDLQLSHEWRPPALESAATTHSKDAHDGKKVINTAGLESATRGSMWQRML
ncbi:MAG: TonB-dependent receptor, partial [Pyrinomonadaceae bacterium]|nr:TonB-dependent receptor [Pyrinomonadaceae bacterium]